MLTFILWVFVGTIAGFIGRSIAPPPSKKPRRLRPPLPILAVLGAVVSGMACDILVRSGSTALGVDYLSIAVSAAGAAIILTVARIVELHSER